MQTAFVIVVLPDHTHIFLSTVLSQYTIRFKAWKIPITHKQSKQSRFKCYTDIMGFSVVRIVKRDILYKITSKGCAH